MAFPNSISTSMESWQVFLPPSLESFSVPVLPHRHLTLTHPPSHRVCSADGGLLFLLGLCPPLAKTIGIYFLPRPCFFFLPTTNPSPLPRLSPPPALRKPLPCLPFKSRHQAAFSGLRFGSTHSNHFNCSLLLIAGARVPQPLDHSFPLEYARTWAETTPVSLELGEEWRGKRWRKAG